MQIRQKLKAEEKGAITIILLLGITVLIAFMAMAIDMGAAYLQHMRLKTAVDIAAYAVGRELPVENTSENQAALAQLAKELVRVNAWYATSDDITVQLKSDGYEIYAAKVIARERVKDYFSRVLFTRHDEYVMGDFICIMGEAGDPENAQLYVTDST